MSKKQKWEMSKQFEWKFSVKEITEEMEYRKAEMVYEQGFPRSNNEINIDETIVVTMITTSAIIIRMQLYKRKIREGKSFSYEIFMKETKVKRVKTKKTEAFQK